MRPVNLAATALWSAAAVSAAVIIDAQNPAEAATSDGQTYDYIVVGSGPGGAPVAVNLAKAGFSTLLIEAGDDQGNNSVYTELANFAAAGNDESSRWDFWVKHTDNETLDRAFAHYTYQLPNGSFYSGLDPPAGAVPLGIQYPRAATLGGCAMHNAGVCSLAQDDNWDEIAALTGDDSWAAAKMRRYLVEIEHNLYIPQSNTSAASRSHGYHGWLETSTQPTTWARNSSSPATRVARKLAELTGQNASDVANLVNQDILGTTPNFDELNSLYNMVQHADGSFRRSDPNQLVHAAVADPANYPLTVRLNSLVTRVLFANASTNTTTGRAEPVATGVEIMSGHKLYHADPRHTAGTQGPLSKVWARKEVIVSGGVFNTPQILKLSGIGPADELAQFNIPLVKDLPGVGQRLADNYEGSLLTVSQEPVGGGYITMLFKTPTSPGKQRNIFVWCGAFSFEGFWPGFPTDYGSNQYECAMVHMRPKSQAGTVLLTSADPLDPPAINLHMFLHNGTQDLQELVDGANLLRQGLWAAGSPVTPFDEHHPCPGTGNGNCTNDEELYSIRSQAYSHHATSTAAIGADSDPLAVLDSKFRVRGVKNLRVVDGSAFPRVPGAFPVLPTIMMSQKASEVIIADAQSA